jgi:hypothetical protein
MAVMRKYSGSLNAAITEPLSKYYMTTISCFAAIDV